MIADNQRTPAGPVAGGVAGLIGTHPWGSTALGPRADWPPCLRAAVSLMVGSRSAVFVGWGADLALVYNDAYAELLGDRHPDALGRPHGAVWPDIWDALRGLADRTLAGEPIVAEDMTFTLLRDGAPREASYSFSSPPLRDDDGAVLGVFCVCSETTARVRAIGDLRASEARMRGVLEGMTEGFVLLGPDFRILAVNAEGLRIDGRPVEALVGLTHWEAFPGSEASRLGELYRHCMERRVPVPLEHRYV